MLVRNMLKITFLTPSIFCNSTLDGTAFQFWGLAHENHHIHFFFFKLNVIWLKTIKGFIYIFPFIPFFCQDRIEVIVIQFVLNTQNLIWKIPEAILRIIYFQRLLRIWRRRRTKKKKGRPLKPWRIMSIVTCNSWAMACS